MTVDSSQVVRESADKVRRRYPDANIWVFGSCARGDASNESDIDVCVVIPEMHSKDRFVISDLAWDVSFYHNVHLSTIVFSQKDFDDGPASTNPLIDVIKTEGIAA